MGKEQVEQNAADPEEIYQNLSIEEKIALEPDPTRRAALNLTLRPELTLLYGLLGRPLGITDIARQGKETSDKK